MNPSLNLNQSGILVVDDESGIRQLLGCDVYDALRSARPYKPALKHDQAMKIIVKGDRRTKPRHFDPAVLDAFQRSAGAYRDIYATNADQPLG
jgi:putative two-component system response regulator